MALTLGALDFSLPAPDALNFGRSTEIIPDVQWVLDAVLPSIQLTAHFAAVFPLRHEVRVWQSTAERLLDTSRFLLAAGQPLTSSTAALHQQAQPMTAHAAMHVHAGRPQAATFRIQKQAGQPLTSVRSFFADASRPMAMGCVMQQYQALQIALRTLLDYQAATPLLSRTRLDQACARHFWDMLELKGGSGHPFTVGSGLKWHQGRPPPHGWRTSRYPRPFPEKHWGRLNFVCLPSQSLNFGRACFGAGRLAVAIRRSYRVLNAASLVRIGDDVDIPVTRMSVQFDRDSWCWTLRASLPTAAAVASVPAYPGKVRAHINGFSWNFIVDEVTWDRAFASFTGNLSGRSPAATYAEPYSLAASYQEMQAKTAEQLALDCLGPDWALDWQLPTWTVPGGTFQYENLTSIEVLVRLAKAAGGWLHADAQDAVLHILPRWPQKPWAWGFLPDMSLPSSYTLKESQQPVVSTRYESILVSGGKNGIAAVCTRAGTGGATVAPAVTDRLITDIEPAQWRAVQEIADLWPMKKYSLTMPVQAQPAGAGLLLPGTTFDFVDGEYGGFRGLVTGVSIDAMGGETWQTVEVVAP